MRRKDENSVLFTLHNSAIEPALQLSLNLGGTLRAKSCGDILKVDATAGAQRDHYILVEVVVGREGLILVEELALGVLLG